VIAVRSILLWLLVLLRCIKRPDFRLVRMAIHPSPDDLHEGLLVLVEDGGVRKHLCFRCPGGCGEKIILQLSPKRTPHWSIRADFLGRPTVRPSIQPTNDCGCHFWIRNGVVEWCAGGRPRAGIPLHPGN
jgi:hypothetical protein